MDFSQLNIFTLIGIFIYISNSATLDSTKVERVVTVKRLENQTERHIGQKQIDFLPDHHRQQLWLSVNHSLWPDPICPDHNCVAGVGQL